MDKIKFNFTDEELKTMIYNVVSDKKFWVNKIDRVKPDTLEGTIISLKPYNEEDKSVIEIQFLHDKLDVSGMTPEQIRKLYKIYFEEVFKKVPEYAEEHQLSKSEIETFILDYGKTLKNLLKDVLYESGFYSLARVKSKLEAYKIYGPTQGEVKIGNHVTFFQLPDNKFASPNREIKIGSIYYTNLDPVTDNEFGGIRPCLVIGYTGDQENYYVIPFSTKKHLGNSVGEIDGRENFAVESRIKLVAPGRFYEHLGDLDNEIYKKVIERVVKNNFIFSNLEGKEIASFAKNPEEIRNEEKDIEPLPAMVNNIEFTKNQLAIDMLEKQLISLNEEEIIKLVEGWVNQKKKEGKNFSGAKGEKFEYSIEWKKDTVIVRLNTKYTNRDQGYLPYKLEFKQHEVYSSTDEAARGYREPYLTTLYQRKRLEKDEHFYISLFFYLVRKIFFSYKRVEEEDLDGAMFDEKVAQIKRIFKNAGISYEGDYEELVLKGDRAIDMDLIHYDDNENENQ